MLRLLPTLSIFSSSLVAKCEFEDQINTNDDDIESLKQKLTMKLKPIRDRLHRKGMKSQPLGLGSSLLSNNNNNNNNNSEKGISIHYYTVPSESTAAFNLFQEWLKIIKKEGNGIMTTTTGNNNDNNNCDGNEDEISFISSGSKSSLVVDTSSSKKNKYSKHPPYLSLYLDTNNITNDDLDCIVKGYESAMMSSLSSSSASTKLLTPYSSSSSSSSPSYGNNNDPIKAIENLGVEVYNNNTDNLDWNDMCGNDDIKKDIVENIISCLENEVVYDNVAKHTRSRFESNRPKAILFDGSPGTGKTLAARIIAVTLDKPMIILRQDTISSKWYGESEKRLGQILDLTSKITNGAIIFIDEIDSIAGSRDDLNLHEASRKSLSVILQHLEGKFKSVSVTILVIC